MARDFYEGVTGRKSVDDYFEVLDGVEVWVYPRGVATIDNYQTLSAQLASIYQRGTGASGGPSPEAGAAGTNPFITGASGSMQFWAETGEYDIFIHDLDAPPRIADRLIPWNAVIRVRAAYARATPADISVAAATDIGMETLEVSGLHPIEFKIACWFENVGDGITYLRPKMDGAQVAPDNNFFAFDGAQMWAPSLSFIIPAPDAGDHDFSWFVTSTTTGMLTNPVCVYREFISTE